MQFDQLKRRDLITLLVCAGALTLLAACGQETRFVAPPPPKVIVQLPVQQTVTPYLEATGNTASMNTIKGVARVEGYVQEIKYQDGDAVKKGTPLFVISMRPFSIKPALNCLPGGADYRETPRTGR